MELLAADGIDIRFLSVPYLFPRPDLSEAVEAAETTVVVECNARGQFANLLERDVFQRVERINKYNGVRFEADELVAEITDLLRPQEATTQ
jgi:2-oxoglutarate ferredoxin oxidoreductase subunit alpha